jgi:hypothetical protein
MMRVDGELIMMESTEHGCDVVFPRYNSTTEGDCSYFRIRCVFISFMLWVHGWLAGFRSSIFSTAYSECCNRRCDCQRV